MGDTRRPQTDGARILIIAFSGMPGSGKTTLSTELARVLGVPRVGFGGYVRSVAIQQNLPIDRESLQRLGQSLIEENVSQFCENVLKNSNLLEADYFILDGIRHSSVLSYFRSNYPLMFIYVTAPYETLKNRLKARGEAELIDSLRTEPTEMEVESILKGQADLTVSGESDIVDQISKIKMAINLHAP